MPGKENSSPTGQGGGKMTKLKVGIEYQIKVASQASGIEVGACEVREVLKDGTLGPNLVKGKGGREGKRRL